MMEYFQPNKNMEFSEAFKRTMSEIFNFTYGEIEIILNGLRTTAFYFYILSDENAPLTLNQSNAKIEKIKDTARSLANQLDELGIGELHGLFQAGYKELESKRFIKGLENQCVLALHPSFQDVHNYKGKGASRKVNQTEVVNMLLDLYSRLKKKGVTGYTPDLADGKIDCAFNFCKLCIEELKKLERLPNNAESKSKSKSKLIHLTDSVITNQLINYVRKTKNKKSSIKKQ